VPFGTGAAMTKWMNDADNLAITYNFAAFQDLKQLFDGVDSLFRVTGEGLMKFVKQLPVSVQEYLEQVNFSEKIAEINIHSSSLEAFRKRFFQFFDAFLILRFLNLAHQKYYSKQNLAMAISQLEMQTKK
jgi:hypothetical protein